ncbi:MAG TPA: hypothetical protein VHP33_16925 [Polyangiaceae bacterium]|nr:hypothetical protein [Polyangiaceae bacterium]
MGLGRRLGLLFVAIHVACGAHSVREEPDGSAGSSSTPDPGAGGNPPLPVPCEYETLDATCALGGCPTSPDSFADQCAEGFDVSRGSTVCGGTVVVVGFGFGQTSWFFDASGTLTGNISQGDLVEVCPDGRHTGSHVYGNVCQASGDLADACPPPGDCGATYDCAPSPDCPRRPEDALSSYCSHPRTVSLSASPSTCGGRMVTVQRADDQIRYCYDGRGWLTGIATQQADGSWSSLGTDCRIEGERTYPCLPK